MGRSSLSSPEWGFSRRYALTTNEAAAFRPASPSGKQTTIAHGQHEAVIVEVGGGIRAYQFAGKDVLDGYRVDERCTGSRGLPLIPWPNRIRQGRYEWDGQQLQVPINEIGKGNANHGFTRTLNWQVTANGPHEAVATLRLHPQQGYPFILDLAITYTLGPQGLTVTQTARNVGADACPYGYGAHPYLTVGTDLVDEAVLTVPAATYLLADDAQIPVGRAAVEGTEFDFRHGAPIGQRRLDHAFTDLHFEADGRARVALVSEATGRTVTLWMDEHHPYLMIFSGDTLPPAARRRSLAVEPMTCPPNAFATGEQVRRLEPGESFTSTWGITVEDR